MDEGLKLLVILLFRVIHHVRQYGRLSLHEKSEILSSLFTIAKIQYSQQPLDNITGPQQHCVISDSRYITGN